MVDVSGGVDAITGAMTSIASIAVAVLVLLVTPKLFRWIRGTFDDDMYSSDGVDSVACSECDSAFTMDEWDAMGGRCPDCGFSGVDWYTEDRYCDSCGDHIDPIMEGGEAFFSDDFGDLLCANCRYNRDDKY